MPSVAVIIIGDEILSGKFADENGPFLIRRLRELGADLDRIVVIRDSVPGIAAEVAACASRYDFVLTTGGVGPTHDDMTFDGVAGAFGLPLERRPELVALLERFGWQDNPAALRMATVPQGAELIASKGSTYPVLRVRNVFVFPGVPKLLQIKFEAVAERFVGTPVVATRLVTRRSEPDIAAALTEAAARYPQVAIGSYPRFDEGNPHVIVTLEGRDPQALHEAEALLRGTIPVV